MQIDPRFTMTRNEALALVPDLVCFMENRRNMALWEKINEIEKKAKKGQSIIVAIRDYTDPTATVYARAKVSQVTWDWRNEDGPVIRVMVGNVSWRVDGNGDHFLPVK